MMRWIVKCLSLLFLSAMVNVSHGAEDDILILESVDATSVPRVVFGNSRLARVPCSAASTFKTVLAWAALKEGIATPETRYEVGDSHVPGTPRSITLHQAMFYSSNDYFVELGRNIGKENVTKYAVASRLYPNPVPEDWLGEEWRPVIKGGDLQTTPMRNHLFLRNLMLGELETDASVLESLRAVMEWPNAHPMIRLYGKTGVWGGAVWFNGYGSKQLNRKVRTVFIQGGLDQRNRAIQFFYRGWDLVWNPAWAEKIEKD